MYTFNEAEIKAMQNYEEEDQNRCDVCGVPCKEVLYEFRCYVRNSQQERRLHPFISYISKERGRNLLGVQTKASQLREHVWRDLLQSNDKIDEAKAELEALRDRPAIFNSVAQELQHWAGVTAGGGAADQLEQQRAQEKLGKKLKPKASDVFRALSQATAPQLSALGLALLAVKAGCSTPRPDGFLHSCFASLRGKKPLPATRTMDEEDVHECIDAGAG